MTDEEMKKLAVLFARALQQARSVSDSEHYDHHVFIAERIKQVQARREFWEQLSGHVAKWGAISLLSGIFYALYIGLKAMVKAAA